MLKYAISPFV